MMNTDNIETPLPPPPATPTSASPDEADLVSAVGSVAKNVGVLVASASRENERSTRRQVVLLTLSSAATVALAAGTYGIFTTSAQVKATAERVDALVSRVDALRSEQQEIKAATQEATERAVVVAETQPKVVTLPAMSASGGKPATPPQSILLLPGTPATSARAGKAAVPAKPPQVIPLPAPIPLPSAVPLPLPSAMPEPSSSTGGAE